MLRDMLTLVPQTRATGPICTLTMTLTPRRCDTVDAIRDDAVMYTGTFAPHRCDYEA